MMAAKATNNALQTTRLSVKTLTESLGQSTNVLVQWKTQNLLENPMAQHRIYLVTHPSGEMRLVKAGVRSQALTHVAMSTFGVRVATQDDLVECLTKGIAVENLKSPDQTELELEAKGE